MTDIYDLLYRLGATANYTGFFPSYNRKHILIAKIFQLTTVSFVDYAINNRDYYLVLGAPMHKFCGHTRRRPRRGTTPPRGRKVSGIDAQDRAASRV